MVKKIKLNLYFGERTFFKISLKNNLRILKIDLKNIEIYLLGLFEKEYNNKNTIYIFLKNKFNLNGIYLSRNYIKESKNNSNKIYLFGDIWDVSSIFLYQCNDWQKIIDFKNIKKLKIPKIDEL